MRMSTSDTCENLSCAVPWVALREIHVLMRIRIAVDSGLEVLALRMSYCSRCGASAELASATHCSVLDYPS